MAAATIGRAADPVTSPGVGGTARAGYNPRRCERERTMRAEIKQIADEIQQSLDLLRRYL